MIEIILKFVLSELINGLIKHKNFAENKQKSEMLADFNLPKSIKDYLAKIENADDLLNDIVLLKNFLSDYAKNNSAKLQSINSDFAKKNILHACAEFINDEIAEFIDNPAQSNFSFEANTILYELKKEVDYAQNSILDIQRFYDQIFAEKNTIIIQSPISIDAELKTQIRKYYAKSHPNAFIEFATNKSLLGGIRIFINGQAEDKSWLAQVNLITSNN